MAFRSTNFPKPGLTHFCGYPLLAGVAALFFLCPAVGRAQRALLWVPAGSVGTGEIITLLENNKDLRLTAAPEEIPAELGNRIKKLEDEGRLELALRPAGNPPLPLLYYPSLESVKWEGKPSTAAFTGNDRYFLGLRFGFLRDAALKKLIKIPPGLAMPPGGLVEDYFPLAKSLGVKWLACGPLASTAAAVFTVEGVTAVPFTSAAATAPAATDRFLVFDETAAADPAAVRAQLAAELKNPLSGKKLTVSDALKTALSTTAAPGDIAALASPWGTSKDYTRWAATPVQRGALAALARTRADLMLHLNACLGDYSAAKPAFDEYFSAEDGGKLLALASPDQETASETEIEMRSSLGNAYRLMRATPPPWIFSSLAEAVPATQDAEQLQISVSTGNFEIQNVGRKPELEGLTAGLPATADPYKLWKLDRLKVEVLPETVVFRFYPLTIDNAKMLPSGFSHIALDLYIDINYRPRAGQAGLLPGRPLRPFPENAWEYALEITPYQATLYTATAKGPAVTAVVQPAVQDGAITATVQRGALKGNPLLWAYSALMLEPAGAKNFLIADYIAADIANGYIYAVRPDKRQ